MVFQQILERVLVDHQGRRVVDFVEMGIENGGIDLHPSGVDHGDEQVVLAHLAAELGFHAVGHGFKRVDGHQGQVGGIADAFGRAHPDAQSRVGARTFAHRHGIELRIVDMGRFHHLPDEISNLLGMSVLSLCFAQGYGTTTIVKCHRTHRCGRFQTQYHFLSVLMGTKIGKKQVLATFINYKIN